MDFSTQPASVAQSKKDSVTFSGLELSGLSQEVLQVVEHFNIKNPILITLSYSSSVGSLFTKQDAELIIETAPMVRQEDNQGMIRKMLETNNRLCANPFMSMSPFCIGWRYQKQLAYKTYWTAIASGQKKSYKELEDAALFEKTVDGYILMAKAVESFDLREVDFKEGPQRIFILGENEQSSRLALQKEVISAYQKQTGEVPYVFIVKDAGHIVPLDQPKAYNFILNLIARKKLPKDQRIFSVDNEGQLSPIELY